MKLRVAAAALAVLVTASALQAQIVKPRAGFGRAVAIVGNELLVGEAFNEATSGFVFVYQKVGGRWIQQAALAAPQAKTGDGFGALIAADGDRIIVGAREAAHVFQRDSLAWRHAAALTYEDSRTGNNDSFAGSVAIEGDVAVVGSFGQNARTGSAFVYRLTPSGWTREAVLASPDAKEQMVFGAGVAIVGDDILVGELNHNERTGAVHVFRQENGTWKAVSKILPANAQKGDRFGGPITVSEGRVTIAATGLLGNTGAVYTFARSEDGDYRETARLLAHNGRSGEQFGSAIAATTDNLWIAAPYTSMARGAVYHFYQTSDSARWPGYERVESPPLDPLDVFGGALAASDKLVAIASVNDDFQLGSVNIYEFLDARWQHTAILRGQSSSIASHTSGRRECTGGKAADFECSNVELVSYISADELGAGRGIIINDVWGWTDPQTGKEWALVGRMDGTAFVDISNPERPVVVGNLPMTKGSRPNLWRDVKVYKDHAYIVADNAGEHGMQVFDLTRLRAGRPGTTPVTYEPDHTYRRINSSHNVVINEESGFAYAVGVSGGGETCGGGLHMIDIREPKNPQFAGCFSDAKTGRASTGYSHDAQCIIYKGPDETYRGREICLGSNETMLSIADVTDKKNPVAVARIGYPDVQYSHQGWISDDHRFFYMNDEGDEIAGVTPRTRTIIFDLTDLDDPQVGEMFLSPTAASDHNLYIKGDTMYQAHYKSGLRIVDISNRTKPVEVGFFDTVPYGENNPGFGGAWSSYPYFKSGVIIATSMNEGLFLVKKKEPNKPVL